ncbi:hypothetical protein DX928_20175 [Bacillus swezeyi]|nr:hypothetical protein DX928_20175 [Bacillus swezeyi]
MRSIKVMMLERGRLEPSFFKCDEWQRKMKKEPGQFDQVLFILHKNRHDDIIRSRLLAVKISQISHLIF